MAEITLKITFNFIVFVHQYSEVVCGDTTGQNLNFVQIIAALLGLTA